MNAVANERTEPEELKGEEGGGEEGRREEGGGGGRRREEEEEEKEAVFLPVSFQVTGSPEQAGMWSYLPTR
jgi:hypothetical protein